VKLDPTTPTVKGLRNFAQGGSCVGSCGPTSIDIEFAALESERASSWAQRQVSRKPTRPANTYVSQGRFFGMRNALRCVGADQEVVDDSDAAGN
jgi:hypothetical protein